MIDYDPVYNLIKVGYGSIKCVGIFFGITIQKKKMNIFLYIFEKKKSDMPPIGYDRERYTL